MEHIAPMIQDLALILIVAGIVTLIFKKLKQPLVLGYIVAGFLVGPNMPYTASVIDNANVKLWGDIGVMFLLFSLGLDFSFKKIVKMGSSPIVSALCTIAAMATLGFLVGQLFGWSRMDCIFLGGMLAMSSTAIIYKAFDDLGLKNRQFTSLVMSVLILEDILAIVMMVMLSSIAGGKDLDGGQLLGSILNIGFFLVLWLITGIFFFPWFFRKVKPLMNDEVMLIFSLGLCCFMAVTSTEVGFSSAFGAFIMGSILAETLEAEYIEHLVAPVKNLFSAIFFVSVGMLVNPQILVDYAAPIAVLVLTILVGQAVFGTIAYMLGGQSLKDGMCCGFSMAQIGEFSFIIAGLGLSLGVISDFLYPVVVAVSVITTFLTPYMIRLAEPCYNIVSKMRPAASAQSISGQSLSQKGKAKTAKRERPLLSMIGRMIMVSLAYGIVGSGILGMIGLYVWPLLKSWLPEAQHPGMANAITGIIALVLVSPIIWAYIMSLTDTEEFKALWQKSTSNKLWLGLVEVARAAFVVETVYEVLGYTFTLSPVVQLIVAIVVTAIFLVLPPVKRVSKAIAEQFDKSLHARETMQRA